MIKQEWPSTLTAQEVFDHCVDHLRTQKARCIDACGACCYRSGNPAEACVAGACLTNTEADAILAAGYNDSNFGTLVQRGLLPERLMPHVKMLAELQGIHDCNHARPLDVDAEFALRHTATRYSLTYTAPEVKP